MLLLSSDFRTSVQPTNRVDVKWTVTVIIRFRLASELNLDDRHHVFFRQRTVMIADHRGGWTQIFGCRASELEISGPVVWISK